MIVVLSGEGSSDLGTCNNGQAMCIQPHFVYGPMTLLVDKEIETNHHYSLLGTIPDNYIYISKPALISMIKARRNGRPFSVLGKKRHDVDTGYFYSNALMLGLEAIRLERERGPECAIAVLFRDTDGNTDAATRLWRDKVQSIESGFAASGLNKRGVAMVPRPKSEAWLLCAIRDNYQHCVNLENLPGNDKAPDSAKEQLSRAMGAACETQDQVEWIMQSGIDTQTLAQQMPSYAAFSQSMAGALAECR